MMLHFLRQIAEPIGTTAGWLVVALGILSALLGWITWKHPEPSRWHRFASVVTMICGFVVAMLGVVQQIADSYIDNIKAADNAALISSVNDQRNQIKSTQGDLEIIRSKAAPRRIELGTMVKFWKLLDEAGFVQRDNEFHTRVDGNQLITEWPVMESPSLVKFSVNTGDVEAQRLAGDIRDGFMFRFPVDPHMIAFAAPFYSGIKIFYDEAGPIPADVQRMAKVFTDLGFPSEPLAYSMSNLPSHEQYKLWIHVGAKPQ